MIKIIHSGSNKEIFHNILVCSTFFKKLLGLMFKKSWPGKYDCLLFSSCNMIHSFFVYFPFDAIFLNKEKEIIFLKSYKPKEIGPYVGKGYYVIESPQGTINKFGLKIKDLLLF